MLTSTSGQFRLEGSSAMNRDLTADHCVTTPTTTSAAAKTRIAQVLTARGAFPDGCLISANTRHNSTLGGGVHKSNVKCAYRGRSRESMSWEWVVRAVRSSCAARLVASVRPTASIPKVGFVTMMGTKQTTAEVATVGADPWTAVPDATHGSSRVFVASPRRIEGRKTRPAVSRCHDAAPACSRHAATALRPRDHSTPLSKLIQWSAWIARG